MKKGFTLIELLAVIVILALILAITTPKVLDFVNSSKDSTELASAKAYLKVVEQSILNKNLESGEEFEPNECIIENDGNITCDGVFLEIDATGDRPTSGRIEFEDAKAKYLILTFGDKNISMNSNGEFDYYHLDPGLYDKYDVLLASWDELVDKYGLDVDDGTLSNATDVIDQIDNAFKLVIDESVTSIGDSAFYDCTLREIIIPDSVISIGAYAFSGCTGLTSITIPDSLKSIGEGVFSCCHALTSIIIPDSVTSIGASAFEESALASITIGSGVISISSDAFIYCPSLTSIKVDENNPVYDSRDNSNAIIETATNTLIQGSQNTIIPDSVISIGAYAFQHIGLTSITIPNSVTSIGAGAFEESALASITIGSGVRSIGVAAFWGCSRLTSITIPNNLTTIGDSAFEDCSSLTTIYYKGTVPGHKWGAPSTTQIITNF